MPRESFHGSGSAWLSGFKIGRKHASLLQEVSISDDDVEKHRPSLLAARRGRVPVRRTIRGQGRNGRGRNECEEATTQTPHLGLDISSL